MVVAATILGTVTGCTWVTGGRALSVGGALPADSYVTLRVHGRQRSYLLHLPPSFSASAARPLVVMFHGGGTNANQLAEVSEMNRAADSAGVIVAYPMGTGWLWPFALTWNTADCCGPALSARADDIGLLRLLLAQLTARLHVDTMRIYAAGLSDGGRMAYRVGCMLSRQVAAIAVVSAEMPDTTCRPQRPVSVLAFHGTADRVIRYDNGARRHARKRRFTISIPAAIAFWAEQDGCGVAPVDDSTPEVVHRRYGGCASGSGVELYTIIGGKHAWPGGRRSWLFGPPPTRAIAASSLMLSFFAQHPRRPPDDHAMPPGPAIDDPESDREPALVVPPAAP